MISIKEASFWLHGEHQNSGLTKILDYKTVYFVLSERISSSLIVFLNGYEHIEVLLNPCKITQDQKGLEYYFEAPSISHLKNVLGGDNKDPWKGSRVNNI